MTTEQEINVAHLRAAYNRSKGPGLTKILPRKEALQILRSGDDYLSVIEALVCKEWYR